MTPIVAAFAGLVPLIRSWSQDDIRLERVLDVAKEITGESEAFASWSALKDNPEMLCSLHQRVMEMELDQQKLVMDDRHSARQRDLAFIQSTKRNRRADIMVLAAAMGLLSCLLAITYFAGQMPGEAVGIISTVAGIFGSCLKDAYAFEFGSSRGSKEKDSTVAALLDRTR